jgi:hypothetical protein
MNNNRLSTSGKPIIPRALLLPEIAKLLSAGSNYEIKSSKTYIKSLDRKLSTNKPVSVQILDFYSEDVLETFHSISDCAKYLGVGVATVQYRVLKSNKFLFKGKSVFIKKMI